MFVVELNFINDKNGYNLLKPPIHNNLISEGERYLDFLRFCVWINGESVEENANLVIRLLIRRPECLGVALKGEGQGLYAAFKVNRNYISKINSNTFQEAIVLSEDIRALEEGEETQFLHSPLLKDHA